MIHYFEGRFNIAQEAEQPQHLCAQDRAAWSRGGWMVLQDHGLSQGTDLGFRHPDFSEKKTSAGRVAASLLHLPPGMAPGAGVHAAAAGNHGIQ